MVTIRSVQVALLSILLVGGVMSVIFSLDIPKASSGSGDNLSGFAWSETIGWISMNSTSDGSATSYGVSVAADGTMSGYAWSEHIGWVSFQESSGCPQGTCRPHFDRSTGDVTGWAKALAGGTAQAGGWDGWISLNCANTGACATSNYKVSATSCSWGGYAWGSDVVGWISFSGTATNGSAYGVTGSGDACMGGTCSGTQPPAPGETSCGIGDPTADLSDGDDAYLIVPACGGSASKCLYTCNAGYVPNGTNTDCHLAQCTGTAPSSPGAQMCPGAVDPSSDTPYSIVSGCGASPSKCIRTCSSGYVSNSTGTDCRLTQCNDNNDNDGDGTTDYDGNGGTRDLGCLDSDGNPDINDDDESLLVTNPTINARPRDVVQGEDVTVTWTTGGVLETSCVITANTTNISLAAFAADANPIGGSYTTQVNVRTTYTINCGGLIDSVTVGIQSRNEET